MAEQDKPAAQTPNGLIWRSDGCGHEEPVQADGSYELGDWEDCVHCELDQCIAKVVRP